MPSLLATLPALAPLGLVLAALIAGADRSARHARAQSAARAASLLAVGVAGATVAIAALGGPQVSPLLGLDGLGFSVRVDALSTVMLTLVSILGAVVVQFSRNYLAGEPRQGRFFADLTLTLAAVMGLVLSGNLVQLVVFWSLTSLALHRLLLFFGDRPGAVVAARKKYVVARAGDLCLLVAAVLLARTFGTGDLGELLRLAGERATRGDVPGELSVAVALVGVTAALKGAQFPTHGWLIEMQEAPTPVSALLHAGILNGGTFLVVRLAGVVQLSAPTLIGLVVVGAFTAMFASVVMVTDTRVKVTLAYSSAAHMGFMLLLSGMGAHAVAIAHLVAHSFYKAHAFLSSGSAVDVAEGARLPPAPTRIGAAALLGALVAAGLVVVGIATATGVDVTGSFENAALAAVMALPLTHLVARGLTGGFRLELALRTLGAAALTALAFYTLERVSGALLSHAVAGAVHPAPALVVVVAVVIAAFGAVTLLQLASPVRPDGALGARLYVLARNGLYANVMFDRLVGAATVPPAERRAPASLVAVSAPHAPLPRPRIAEATARATRAIAPVWPLRSFVAVNPFQAFADQPVTEVSRRVRRTTGARMTMPRAFYLDAVAAGRIERRHLAEALADAHDRPRAAGKLPSSVEELLGERPATRGASRAQAASPSSSASPAGAGVPTIADVVSSLSGRDFRQIVVERIGAWAAAYFDEGQASWSSPWRALAPFEAFQAEASLDATPELLGARGFRGTVRSLPTDANAAIEHALARLAVPADALELYLERLLGSILGWASYARYRVWQAELRGETDGTLVGLLAVRLAWEVALLEAFAHEGAEAAWAAARVEIVHALDGHDRDDGEVEIDWIFQSAYEKAWQEKLFADLGAGEQRSAPARPWLQAAFCIDVRSEIYRRALEAAAPGCETIGFAGFFGFPIEYVPLGLDAGGARCPVLLAPKAVVTESVVGAPAEAVERIAAARLVARRARNAWRSFKSSAISCFGFVGPVGLSYLPKLLTDGLGWTRTVPHPSHDGVAADVALAPEIAPHDHHGRAVGLGADERVAMAEGLLRGMSLTSRFARLVVLAGHGSTTVNNPHAAGLDCGACGGHSGEVNARIAAKVLNDRATRAALADRGIAIPEDTVFVACLHDTTTDAVTVCDRAEVPASHAADLERLAAALAEAGRTARALRAPTLGEDPTDPRVHERIVARSRDWSQVRPEWGLAGCSAFVVAPRARTTGKDLGGRVFLHSYDWRADEGSSVLEVIMTAPMVVGSWIGFQYYASTVDNRVFGAGNKVLHNVVGNIGVLEGNGGDLRVGLPWQSLHDGERLMHEPMRLSVLIEAPIAALNAVLEKHPSVRALVDNGWLHLYALDDRGVVAHRYVGGLAWASAAPEPESDAA